MQGNVYLVGPMGAGKTTVGRKLAHLLEREFIDTDHALEERTGVSISHIFEIEGEPGFREREAKLLAEIGARPSGERGAIVATGGGIVLREANRAVMRKSGAVVYLRASPELLWKRLEGNRNRPLLNAPDPQAALAQLLEERNPLYAAEADLIADVYTESAIAMARKIHALLYRHFSRSRLAPRNDKR